MERVLNKKYTPYAFMFFAVFAGHLLMNFLGDDLFFKELGGLASSYKDFIELRYQTCTSRVLIESALIRIVRLNINVWRLLDTLLYVCSTYVVIKMINKDNDPYLRIVGCLLFLIYPFGDMRSAGWVATSMNYMWCYTLGVISFLPLINAERNEKTNVFQYIVCTIGMCYAANAEQACALLLAFHGLYLLNRVVIKKQKPHIYNLVCIAITVISIIFILNCPGNSMRYGAELQAHWPNYEQYGVFDKLYFAITATADIILDNKMVVFAMTAAITVVIFTSEKTICPRVVAAVGMCAVSVLTVFEPIAVRLCPPIRRFLEILASEEGIGVGMTARIVTFALLLLFVACILYLLLVLFGKQQLLPFFLFLGGVCSRMIMGFSPTLYASYHRTAIYLYMMMLMVTFFALEKFYTQYKTGAQNGKLSIE